MKAILLATLGTLAELAAITLLLRLRDLRRRALALTAVWAAGLVPLLAASAATPADLGFLPAWAAGTPLFDHLAAAFFYSAAFFGGVLQLYNLADRGFSLRILVDLLERPDARATVDDVHAGYSAGRGMRWMYEKRIEGLLENGLATAGAAFVRLTPAGARMAGVYRALRRLYHVR